VLVTGGSGYLGTHTCLVLLEKGYEVSGASAEHTHPFTPTTHNANTPTRQHFQPPKTAPPYPPHPPHPPHQPSHPPTIQPGQVTVIDNLANSKLEGLRRVAKLTGMGRYLHFKRLNVSDVVSLSEFLEVVRRAAHHRSTTNLHPTRSEPQLCRPIDRTHGPTTIVLSITPIHTVLVDPLHKPPPVAHHRSPQIPECSACYHLAALKAVGQSCQLPLEYYGEFRLRQR
jgi:hypothetical protein